ncbi:MAG: 30S ribosomal protein S1 [Candidatus Firestonebacteria bacterium]|nr:30S ribosomal protein S1 [Candidatus Firestonebacteria bacterium]
MVEEIANNEKNGGDKEELDMGTLMAAEFSGLEEGKVIKAKVIKVSQESIFVDVGYKSDGMIPLKEFTNQQGQVTVKEGDIVDVLLDRIENSQGFLVLSKIKADRLRNLDGLEDIYKNKDIIEGKILRPIKGGFIVDIGVEVFLPNSQFQPSGVDSAGSITNKIIPVKIIKYGKKKGEIIVSHKVAILDNNRKQRKELWDTVKEGDLRKGLVKSITSYGAFIDIGGVTGLLHISDMSWGKVSHPAEVLAIESEIEVKIIKIDIEKKRISLGLKQLKDDPWMKIEEKYSIGSIINGKIVNILEYGAFIKIDENIEGLLHVSDMSWTKRVKNPAEFLAVGEAIKVKVLNIDKNNRKILFGLKQLERDPFEEIEQKYQPNTKASGIVTGYSGSKVYLEFENGIEGVLNKKDLSWTRKFPTLKGIFRKGERVEALVLNIDKLNRKVNLGLKQLTADPWLTCIPENYKVGSIVKGRVTKVANFGILLELEKDLEGFVHISELSEEPVQKAEDAAKLEEIKEAKVIKLDVEYRKISLSIKHLHSDMKAEELKKYSDSSDGKGTFGDILRQEDGETGKNAAPGAGQAE